MTSQFLDGASAPIRKGNEMVKRSQERRTRQLIDWKQQFKFALTLVFYASMYPILFLFLALVPPFSNMLTDPVRAEPVIRQFVGFKLAHWWIGLLSMLIVLGLSLVFSHKIFGPLSRCEALLREGRNSGLHSSSLQLRRGDYFQGFAATLEQTLVQNTPLVLATEDKDLPAKPRT